MIWLLTLDLIYIIMPLYLKLSSLIFVFLGFWLGLELFLMNTYLMGLYYYLFSNMWFMYSYSYYLYKLIYSFSNNYSMNLNWGEFYGPMGVSYYLLKMSNTFQLYMLGNMKVFFIIFLYLIFYFYLF